MHRRSFYPYFYITRIFVLVKERQESHKALDSKTELSASFLTPLAAFYALAGCD